MLEEVNITFTNKSARDASTKQKSEFSKQVLHQLKVRKVNIYFKHIYVQISYKLCSRLNVILLNITISIKETSQFIIQTTSVTSSNCQTFLWCSLSLCTNVAVIYYLFAKTTVDEVTSTY
jgi:hypothetical protein